MITPDLIPDEAEQWLAAARSNDLDRIFLVAPSSTPERLAKTVEASRGFVYAASTMGVTGARDAVSQCGAGTGATGQRDVGHSGGGRAWGALA